MYNFPFKNLFYWPVVNSYFLMILNVLLVLLKTCSNNRIKINESFQKLYFSKGFCLLTREMYSIQWILAVTLVMQESRICSPFSFNCGGFLYLWGRERERGFCSADITTNTSPPVYLNKGTACNKVPIMSLNVIPHR